MRDLLTENSQNLTDSLLNDQIERATQRIESDYVGDYGVTPRQMIASGGGTILSTGFPLPSDWLKARSVTIGDAVLRYAPPEHMPQTSQHEDAEVKLIYYRTIPRLVNDADTNWLLDLSPRTYLYATAIEYSFWNDEYEDRRAGYEMAYRQALQTTGRANSVRPAGGWGRVKGHQNGFYTIIGDNMTFGWIQ